MNPVMLSDFTVNDGFQLQEVEQKLRQFGAVVLPAWVNAQEAQALLCEWEKMRSDSVSETVDCVSKIGGDAVDYAALYRSKRGNDLYPTINRIFSHAKMIDIIGRVVGNPCLINEEVYATYDVGQDQEIVESHFDKTWSLKFMVYLDDILESGLGAFSVHPGSQCFARAKFREWFDSYQRGGSVVVGTPEYYQMKNDELPQELPACVEILAPAGSLIIFSTDVYHRGSLLHKNKVRRILRAHTHPGYLALGGSDKIRRLSRQYTRSEPWEINNKVYSRFSRAGLLEYWDYLRNPRRVHS